MARPEERGVDRDGVIGKPANTRVGTRRRLPGWQAQLIAIIVTLAVVTVVVLLFGLLTGTL